MSENKKKLRMKELALLALNGIECKDKKAEYL